MAMDYFLKQINSANDATPLRIFLEENEVIIGRKSIISLASFNKVSRKHAKFLNKNGRWYVCDLESLNKLFVNFKEVRNEWTPIEIGDIIGFGTPSYTEDGGFVCVFAVKHRIKQEITDGNECPGFKEKNTENVQNFSHTSVKEEEPLQVKQELPPSDAVDCQRKTPICKPEYFNQTDASASNALSNIANITNGNDTHQSNIIRHQNKSAANSEDLKPVIKTEPDEIDDVEILEIKKTSIDENLLVTQKIKIENANVCDNLHTTNCDVKLAIQNKIEDRIQSLSEDVPSNIRKTNIPWTEYFEEVDEKSFIPENITLRSSERLQLMKNVDCPKIKASKMEKNCSVRLIKCDSDNFQLPPDINYPKLFATEEERRPISKQSIPKTLQDAKKTELNCSNSSQNQNFKSHRKRKNLKVSTQERKNAAKPSLKLKIKKNRILSSSSEMSSDESGKKHLYISNNKALDKKCLRTKSKKQVEDKQSLLVSRRNNGSLDETSPALKISEKRKKDLSENHLKKRKTRRKECESQSNCYDSEYLNVDPSANASSKETDTRNREIFNYSRDESSFCVERSGCSKYWTPEYNEFESGEVDEGMKLKFIKKKQTAGRILLTDPKPIEYRPKRMRGREKRFKKQSSYSSRDSDHNESISENVNEKTPNPSKKISKLSSSSRCALSKEHSFVVNEKFSAILSSNPTIVSSKEQKTVEENELFAKKSSDTSEIGPNLTETKKYGSKYLPKELFSKNDKLYDRKIAVVTPNKKRKQSDTFSAEDFHNPVQKTITNSVSSTYILTCSKPIQTNPDPTCVEDASEDSKDPKMRSRYLIKCIVQWNPKWLEEQAKNKKPPPAVSKGGSALPLRFSSYDTYIKSFHPMISLEIWESLFRESKPFWLKKEVKNAFYFKVISNNLKLSLIELQCESFVNENSSFFPSEGNVVLLGFNEFGNGLENSLLGYIHRHKVEGTREMEKMKEWQNVPAAGQVNVKLRTFSLYIKKSKRHFSIGSVNLAYGILNIKNKLQLADALGGFKDSPIQSDILQPTKDMFCFSNSISKMPQPQLIQAVSEEIKKEKPHGKLILINAPVATGKTSAIIGIVEKLLFSNTARIKLLLCAPSDIAVDEIGLRLVELNERCSWRGNAIKFVRFGLFENVSAKLQAYTLERKVLKMFKEQHKKEFQDREEELKVLEDKINDVLFKEQLKSNNKNIFSESNDEALKHLTDQLQYLKENSPYKSIDPVIHTKYEKTILSESDVVLTTLHSCMHPQMRKFFKSCNEACCIIDEISQCTESEVLQCLHPEINRLVVVGDLQQLQPPVSSKYAIQWGFKRSMMERILKLFNVQFSFTPPLSLAEQHRMQSQICHFPSKYFYKEQLLTVAGVDEKYKHSPLKPFIVYDVLEKEMPNSSVNLEHSEPFIIATICAQILQAVPTASLGVIVICEDLAAIYRIPLSQGSTALKEIEVNTVENFQGREKDVIIISCINPSIFAEHDNFLSSENKMNVVITRARQSLIICGHVSSLTQFKHWNALVTDAKERKNFISVSSLRQIPFVVMKSICRMG